MKANTLLVLLCLVCLSLAPEGALAQSLGGGAWPLEVKVISGKSDRLNKSGEIDDRNVKVQYTVEVTNRDGKRALEGAKVTLMAFAKDVVDRNAFVVVSNDNTTMTLPPLGKQSFEGKATKLEYDDKAYGQHGYKPYGYLVIVQDAKGTRLYVKGNPAGLDDKPDKAAAMEAGTLFDKRSWVSSGKTNLSR